MALQTHGQKISPQFALFSEPNGDVMMEGGLLIAARADVRIEVPGGRVMPAPSPDSASLAAVQGIKLVVATVPDPAVPAGEFRPATPRRWEGLSALAAFWTVDEVTGVLSLCDGVDVVATAPAGSVPLAGRIPCASAATAGGDGGGEYEVDLGTATGTVTLSFTAFSVPDHFLVEWDGAVVIDSGLRGTSGSYDGEDVVVDGSGSGTLSFNKTTASPSTAVVTVRSPYTGTAWEWSLGCPGGGTPPYTAPSGSGTFTATSTAYGETLAGGPFTLSVAFSADNSRPSETALIYLKVEESGPGVPATVTGPFFDTALPENADPVYYVAIGRRVTGGYKQIQDGPIVWAGGATGGGGGGSSIVQIGLADYSALSPPDSGTLYAITGP